MDQIDTIARDSWAKVLGCDVHDETNFVEAGGDSISAILLVAEVNAALGVALSPHVLLETGDFRAFRQELDALCGGPAEEAAAAPAPGGGTGLTVTSPLQERWFGLAKEQLGNVDLFLEVTGEIDHELFDLALAELCERHAVLRSVYEDGHPPMQRALLGWRPQARIQNLEGLPEDEVEATIHAAFERSLRFFDIETEVPFELELLTLTPTHHLLIGHLHHIATDGWSVALLIEDLERIYRVLEEGSDPAHLEPAPQYETFAAKQREYVAGGDIEKARDHWRSVFKGVGGATTLPATMPPEPAGPDESSRYVNLLLDTGQAEDVRRFAQAHRVTVYNVLLSAFARLLADVTGKDDLLIGTSTAGRSGGEDDGCLGVFISPMPLRLNLADADSPDRLTALVAERMVDLAKYRMYPFADLIESVEPFVGKQLADVFAIHFIYQNQPQPNSEGGRSYRQLDFQDAALTRPHNLPRPRSRVLRELEVVIFDQPDRSLSVNFAFNPKRFNETEVSGWLAAYGARLTGLVQSLLTSQA